MSDPSTSPTPSSPQPTEFPSDTNNATCVLPYGRSILVDGTCDCNAGYSGENCRELLSWWLPFVWSMTALGILFMLYGTMWASMKLYHIKFTQKKKLKRLSPVAVILTLVGCVLRLVSFIFGRPTRNLKYGDPVIETGPWLFCWVITYSVCVGCWILAFNLIVGFWMDMLSRKLAVKMGRNTKLMCMIGGCLVGVLLSAGFIISLGLMEPTFGGVLIAMPLILDLLMVVVFTAIAFYHGHKYKKSMSDANKARHSYAIKLFIIGSVAWLFTIVVGVATTVSLQPGRAHLGVFFNLAGLFGELAIVLTLMHLSDRHGGPWRLFQAIRGADTILSTTTQSSNSNSNSGTNSLSTASGIYNQSLHHSEFETEVESSSHSALPSGVARQSGSYAIMPSISSSTSSSGYFSDEQPQPADGNATVSSSESFSSTSPSLTPSLSISSTSSSTSANIPLKKKSKKKMNSKKMNSKKMDSKKMDSKKMNSKKMDSKKMNSKKMDSKKMDNKKMSKTKTKSKTNSKSKSRGSRMSSSKKRPERLPLASSNSTESF